MKKVTLEFYIPEKYGTSELFTAAILDAIKKAEFIKKDIIKCISKNGIKIVHPDNDDIIRVKSFEAHDYPLAHEVLREFVLPTYFDPELDESLWDCSVFEKLFVDDEKVKNQLSEMETILRRDHCSYFRFEKH
jgi:hypothetical protein